MRLLRNMRSIEGLARFRCLIGFSAAMILAPLLTFEAGAQQNDFIWLLGYRDKGENALAQDNRFRPFLRDHLPKTPLRGWADETVNGAASTFLGGVPGYIEVRDNRYFAASGCPAHACVARALLWVDTQSRIVVFIATEDEKPNEDRATRDQYHIASAKLDVATEAAIDPAHLPDELRGAIIRWMHLEGVLNLNTVTLWRPSGPRAITTDQLCWTGSCASTVWN